MLPFYGMGLGAESGADDETTKALAAAAAASTSTHSAFSLQMYNQMLAYSSMLAQSMGMTTQASYAQALASAGITVHCLSTALVCAYTSLYH